MLLHDEPNQHSAQKNVRKFRGFTVRTPNMRYKMIFLSYTHSDKSIVDLVAQSLAKAFGQDKVFFDQWSIQPGDGIIDKMNSGLEECKYFFFFVSKHSLQSNMVKLEWQNALYKSTKEKVNIIPIKVDNSMMPAIIAQTLYVDIFGQGIETAIRQIIDVIAGNNIYRLEQKFYNVRACVTQKEFELTVEFKAEVYMEPHSKYVILLENPKDDLTYKAINGGMFLSDFREKITLSNGIIANAIFIGGDTITSPGFPFIVEVTSKTKLKFIGAMHATSHESYQLIPVIYKKDCQ